MRCKFEIEGWPRTRRPRLNSLLCNSTVLRLPCRRKSWRILGTHFFLNDRFMEYQRLTGNHLLLIKKRRCLNNLVYLGEESTNPNPIYSRYRSDFYLQYNRSLNPCKIVSDFNRYMVHGTLILTLMFLSRSRETSHWIQDKDRRNDWMTTRNLN